MSAGFAVNLPLIFDFKGIFMVYSSNQKRMEISNNFFNMLKCIKLHKRIHIIVILHIYRKRVPSVHGRWFQRKSSRARIKKQFSASLKWVSIFGSQILTLSLQINEGQVVSDYCGSVS